MKRCPYCGRRPERPEGRCGGCGADRSFDPTVRGGKVLGGMVVAFGWFGVVLYFGGYRGEVANALVVVLLAPVAGLSWWFGRRWRGG